jgi:hypothetical protein
MNIGLSMITDNIGMTLEGVVLLIGTLAAVIFAAKDFKLSIIVMFITNALMFIIFHEVGLNWNIALTMLMLDFVIMVLTLYAVNKTSRTGGFT